mmetsp:Transcript_42886/g.102013  ORF Transcript_42886/g.102013 Transcript_42886/m.102013 type:complete len:298 (-) Transcript_42886:872-1765(-)
MPERPERERAASRESNAPSPPGVAPRRSEGSRGPSVGAAAAYESVFLTDETISLSERPTPWSSCTRNTAPPLLIIAGSPSGDHTAPSCSPPLPLTPLSAYSGMTVSTSEPCGGSSTDTSSWRSRTRRDAASCCHVTYLPVSDTRPSTSAGLNCTVTAGGGSSGSRKLRMDRSQQAPWRLNAPITPPWKLRFHTLRPVLPSVAGSAKRQSRVGRPGSRARSTAPSGSTSLRRSVKSCTSGRSEVYTAHPPTARAAAWRRAAGCSDWNMSQSGCTISPRNSVLYTTLRMWTVCEAGSRG